MLLAEAMARILAVGSHLLLPTLVRLQHGEMVGLVHVEHALHRARLVALVHRREEGRAVGERGRDEQDGLRAAKEGGVEDESANANVDGQRGKVAAERRELLVLIESGGALQPGDRRGYGGLGRRRERALKGRAQRHVGEEWREAQLEADLLQRPTQHLWQPRGLHVPQRAVASEELEDVPRSHAPRTPSSLARLRL